MGSSDMSKRAHWVLRLAALAVIAAAAWLPRGSAAPNAAAAAAALHPAAETQTLHASVAVR